MNVKLKSFDRQTTLYLEGRMCRIHVNVWCDLLTDTRLKLNFMQMQNTYVKDYFYHIHKDAICYHACSVSEESRRWHLSREARFIEDTIKFLEYVKNKSDYEIFNIFAQHRNVLLHNSVFKLVNVMRERNLEFKVCDLCMPDIKPKPSKKVIRRLFF